MTQGVRKTCQHHNITLNKHIFNPSPHTCPPSYFAARRWHSSTVAHLKSRWIHYFTTRAYLCSPYSYHRVVCDYAAHLPRCRHHELQQGECSPTRHWVPSKRGRWGEGRHLVSVLHWWAERSLRSWELCCIMSTRQADWSLTRTQTLVDRWQAVVDEVCAWSGATDSCCKSSSTMGEIFTVCH